MSQTASQITSLTIVYSIVYSGTDQRKRQSSASLAFVWGIQRGPVNSPHKWPVTRKMFPFDDVIMICPRYSYNTYHLQWAPTLSVYKYLGRADMAICCTNMETKKRNWAPMIKRHYSVYNETVVLRSHMMTSSNGNIFRVAGLLWGEFTGHRWIPLTKASDAELWYFLWSAPE